MKGRQGKIKKQEAEAEGDINIIKIRKGTYVQREISPTEDTPQDTSANEHRLHLIIFLIKLPKSSLNVAVCSVLFSFFFFFCFLYYACIATRPPAQEPGGYSSTPEADAVVEMPKVVRNGQIRPSACSKEAFACIFPLASMGEYKKCILHSPTYEDRAKKNKNDPGPRAALSK